MLNRDFPLDISLDEPRAIAGAGRLRQIIETAAAMTFAVPLGAMRAPSRSKAEIAFARQVAMYLAHVSAGLSHRTVARYFGRNRGTVAHACRVVEDARSDPMIDRAVAMLEAVCGDGALASPTRGVQP